MPSLEILTVSTLHVVCVVLHLSHSQKKNFAPAARELGYGSYGSCCARFMSCHVSLEGLKVEDSAALAQVAVRVPYLQGAGALLVHQAVVVGCVRGRVQDHRTGVDWGAVDACYGGASH